VNITVTPVNDIPTITVPLNTRFFLFPDKSMSDLVASDPDAGNGILDCWVNTTHTVFGIGRQQVCKTRLPLLSWFC
jgi:hypothetical protein